jgi:membrane protein implicated in regulation of membrane protease activity
MTWENFYLVCFLIGLILSVLSFFVGLLNLHIPGFESLHHMHPHAFHLHWDALQLPHGELAGISPFNFSSLMAFLAWFGGAGYLLTVWGKLGLLAIGALSVGAGLTGAMIVFLFLAKVLMRNDATLYSADYHMEGLLGRVSSGIREGGTGEIIYSQEGVRRTCGARAEDGTAIAKGTEIVITRYERGIAYVRKWEEMAKEAGVTSNL